ncbi:hypothetical protein A2U01_0084768, partial [Trifolium medium]|nr:hypothetical protein [Trifolium medium]
CQGYRYRIEVNRPLHSGDCEVAWNTFEHRFGSRPKVHFTFLEDTS